MDVRFCLYGRWILVLWMLNFGCLDVGLGCVDVGFWLYERWILFVWTLDFVYMDVGFGFCGC